MAGFTGGRKSFGIAGIPPAAPGPIVSLSSTVGSDTFYLAALTMAEDINPDGPSYSPVRSTAQASNTTDTYYILGIVMGESGNSGSNSGRFRITEMGSVGSETYYILGFVLSE